MRARGDNKIRANRARAVGRINQQETVDSDDRQQSIPLAGLIQQISVEQLKLPSRVLRSHSKQQITRIAESMRAFGFVVPIVVDQDDIVRAGIGRLAAAQELRLATVPVVRLENLSEPKLRAFQLADNKVAEGARWNREALSVELPELKRFLLEEGLDIDITGFEAVEIDQLDLDFEDGISDPADGIDARHLAGRPLSCPGDMWKLGPHRLLCADGRNIDNLKRLLEERHADMAFLDVPYNVSIDGVVGRGKIKHAEFAMASGEMTYDQYVEFLQLSFDAAAAVSRDGAVHYVCMDWRHLGELMAAGRSVYPTMLNLAVWVKSNAGQGSFYRSQHEHIGVFRVGKSPHTNNVQLGKHGRSRSNVWHYAGVNSFRAGRLDDLRAHPTVKPIAMVCDAIRDCTRRDDVVLDTFCGSGTTILAAERIGRHAAGIEIEPRFVDLAIRRWQEFSGKDAIHAESGCTFQEVAAHWSRQRVGATS